MAGKGKVLLMDDEQIILDVTLEVLRFLEYDVMFAREGTAALELYKHEKEAGVPFDLVILDLSVPEGLGGKDAIALLKAYDPAVKAIVSSGYSNDPAVQNFSQYGFSGILSKPYKISDMKEILEKLIKKS
jgi:CheY-like chemotaxis protein